jgi:polysaccharide deacetylase 2 family uncharacterized protein YibQ
MRLVATGRNARPVIQLKQTLDWVVKNWGYEYILVACGAILGLLIVVMVGFDEPPMQSPVPPEIAAPQPPSPAPKPSQEPAEPAKASKRVEPDPRRAVSTPAKKPVAAIEGKDAPAWQRFAAIHGPILGRPMIAVIMDDMGLDRQRGARAVQLPGPLTMSFLTYARSLKSQAADARRAGHEIMIHVPMEPDDTSAYPGPKAIKRDLPEKELRRRLDWVLGRLDNFVGINNHMGSRFTTHGPGMEFVLAELKRRGLLFIDSRTSPKTVGAAVARRLSLPFAPRDLFLDDDPSREAVARQLMALEQAASEKGYAIAIGHPYDLTLNALEKWLPTLASRGFVLVPVSAIVRHRQKAG